jgi:hypothetical protein
MVLSTIKGCFTKLQVDELVEKTKAVDIRQKMPISMQMKHQLGANWQEPLQTLPFYRITLVQ